MVVQTAGAVQFQISDAVEFNKIIDTNAVLSANAMINSQFDGAAWVPNGQCLVFRLNQLGLPATDAAKFFRLRLN